MIDANRVRELFLKCLSEDGVMVEGIMGKYGLAVEDHVEEISGMLKELPDDFQADGGGGMSFLNACMTKDGEHWGEHQTMEQLFCLGIAADKCQWLFSRVIWPMLPGGMPYVVVK